MEGRCNLNRRGGRWLDQGVGEEGLFEGRCEFNYPGVVGAFPAGDARGSDGGGAGELELFEKGASWFGACEWCGGGVWCGGGC